MEHTGIPRTITTASKKNKQHISAQ